MEGKTKDIELKETSKDPDLKDETSKDPDLKDETMKVGQLSDKDIKINISSKEENIAFDKLNNSKDNVGDVIDLAPIMKNEEEERKLKRQRLITNLTACFICLLVTVVCFTTLTLNLLFHQYMEHNVESKSSFKTLSNGVNMHLSTFTDTGSPGQFHIVALHGFPEGWSGYFELLEELLESRYSQSYTRVPFKADVHSLASMTIPDLRGYNLTSQLPDGKYHIDMIIEDLYLLIKDLKENVYPGKNIILLGNDWGVILASIFASKYPDLIFAMVAINGPHPNGLMNLFKQNSDQRNASDDILNYISKDYDKVLSENNFEKLRNLFFNQTWFNGRREREYVNAWNRTGAVKSMLNWYSENFKFDTPLNGSRGNLENIKFTANGDYKIKVPTLVVWGLNDKKLLYKPNLEEFRKYISDEYLYVKEISNSGHWVIHEKPKEVSQAIKEFVKVLY